MQRISNFLHEVVPKLTEFWNYLHCKQLFNDLCDVLESKRKSHFFGSIVYLYNDESEENGRECIIIDGQQRITTLTLLMLALIHIQEQKKDDALNTDLLLEYLVGKYTSKEKIKLKPVKNDAAALKAIFDKNWKEHTASNIVINYPFFKELLQKRNILPSDIFSAIKRLDIIDIQLKSKEDDPQLIFESLNSTGLDLSEADKVRNFMLMRLGAEKQNEYYEKYWNVIEKNTNYNVSGFVRDYLTYKERRLPNINKVYFTFKDYISKNETYSIEAVLSELLVFSEYYNRILNSNHQNKRIAEVLTYLKTLDMTVAYPFLLEIFNDYYREKILSDDDLLNIFLLIESFIVRRLICDVPTNALNKLFMMLSKDIKSFPDYKEKYVEVAKYVLSQKRGSQRFPKNDEIREKMPIKDFYNMNTKNNMHILERLENFENKEKIDLQKLLVENNLSIEHIMPQTLSKAWKNELGADYETIHATCLHTIGNLTLTAYNSEMSNKLFSEKKTIKGGFLQSKLYLNDYIKNQDVWNKNTILERAGILIEKTLKIWQSCQTTYENIRDVENTYCLNDEVNFTGEKIKYFMLLGQKIAVDNWKHFLQQFCISVYDLEPAKFRNLLIDTEFTKKSLLLAEDESVLRSPAKIAEDIFIEGNLSVDNILYVAKLILQKLTIDTEEVSICLREDESGVAGRP